MYKLGAFAEFSPVTKQACVVAVLTLYRTRGYDVIQDVQQGIYYTKKIDNS